MSSYVKAMCAVTVGLMVLIPRAAQAQDTTPPAVFDLVSPTNGAWASATPRFDWQTTTDDHGVTEYELWVDGVLLQDTISPSTSEYMLTVAQALTEGFHTWFVRAYDAAGNMRQSTSTWTVRVDATPPATFSLLAPPDGSWQNPRALMFSWEPSTDTGSGLADYRLYMHGSRCRTLTVGTTSSRYGEGAWYCNLADGSHAWYVEARDNVGNLRLSASRTVRLDSRAPAISAARTWTGSVDARSSTAATTWADTGIDLASGSRVSVSASGRWCLSWDSMCCGPDGGCASGTINGCWYGQLVGKTGLGSSWSCLGSSMIWTTGAGGRVYLASNDSDWNNNTGSLSVDLTTEEYVTRLDSPATGACTADTTPSFVWRSTTDTGSGHAGYDLCLGRAPVATANSEFSLNTSSWRQVICTGCMYGPWFASWGGRSGIASIHPVSTTSPGYVEQTVTVPSGGCPMLETSVAITAGPSCYHDAYVGIIVVDAGLTHALWTALLNACHGWVDLRFDLTPWAGRTVTIRLEAFAGGPGGDWSYEAAAVDYVRVFGAERSYTAPASASTFEVPLVSPLADGVTPWWITSKDGVGNGSPSELRTLNVDTRPPAAFDLSTPTDAACVDLPTPTLCWAAATDALCGVQEYEIWVDDTRATDAIPATARCGTPSLTLAQGAHTWHVVAEDQAGNRRTSSTTRTLYVDRDPPAAFGLVSPADGVTVYTTTPTFTWSPSSDGSGLRKYVLLIDGAVARDDISPTATSATPVSALLVGPHDWYVVAHDNCGATATSPVRAVTVRECEPGRSEACVGSDIGACDPGVRTCGADGRWGTCVGVVGPTSEVCNDEDDDCDGTTDEDFACRIDASGTCTSSCGSAGTRTCAASCTWGPCAPPAETCNGRDDDCDGAADNGFACPAGTSGSCATACGSTGSRTCSPSCAWDACIPPAEVCNSTDDDCDGSTDEGFSCILGASETCTTACGSTGRRTCGAGCTWSSCAPPAETCNGADDDCDGATDEGTNACGGVCSLTHDPDTPCDGPDADLCAEGTWTCDGLNAVTCSDVSGDSAESCNDIDDDCEGTTDEDFAVGALCTVGVGACAASGVMVCSTDGTTAVCSATPGMPGIETCGDGIDGNCDGTVDEGCACIPGERRPCGLDEGACTAGVQVCTEAGTWGDCEGPTGPAPETCNGSDDDCDGVTDEGCGCTEGGERLCGTDEGECAAGTQTCVAGRWGRCEGAVAATPEVCADLLDNDCDGLADEECVAPDGGIEDGGPGDGPAGDGPVEDAASADGATADLAGDASGDGASSELPVDDRAVADMGSPEGGDAAAGHDVPAADGGADAAEPTPAGGCGCRTGGTSGQPSVFLVALIAALIFARRRHRVGRRLGGGVGRTFCLLVAALTALALPSCGGGGSTPGPGSRTCAVAPSGTCLSSFFDCFDSDGTCRCTLDAARTATCTWESGARYANTNWHGSGVQTETWYRSDGTTCVVGSRENSSSGWTYTRDGRSLRIARPPGIDRGKAVTCPDGTVETYPSTDDVEMCMVQLGIGCLDVDNMPE